MSATGVGECTITASIGSLSDECAVSVISGGEASLMIVDPFTADAINGDSWIVYPGYEKLYPSIRLCAMRDGIRDFDPLKLVEAKDKETAQEFVKEMVQDYGTYNTEIEHFRDLRKRMLEYLSR